MVLVLKDEVRTARKFYDCDASEMWRSYGQPRDAVTADERLVPEREEEDARDFDDGQDDALCWECGQIHDVCECHVGEECGRWRNGRLDKHCSKAGSEECDFECPYSR